MTKFIINQAVEFLNATSKVVEELRIKMNETASGVPEYSIVMRMKGVGSSLGSQLIVEIGDVTRFMYKGAISAFAGVDPCANQSGIYEQQSVRTSKHGSAQLRKMLFQIMDVLMKTATETDPVYNFMMKKRFKEIILSIK